MENEIDIDSVNSDLKKVGKILIYAGTIDIALMIVCILAGINYSSIINIFAVIAGIFLYRGSLKAARIVAWMAAFYVLAFPLLAFSLLYDFPFDLFVLYLKCPGSQSMILSITFLAASYILVLWLYRTLTSDKITLAFEQAGLIRHFWSKPWFGFIGAIILFLVLSPLIAFKADSSFQNRAINEARSKVTGGDYKYYVQSLKVSHIKWINTGESGTYVWAQVIAYNYHSYWNLSVEWKQ